MPYFSKIGTASGQSRKLDVLQSITNLPASFHNPSTVDLAKKLKGGKIAIGNPTNFRSVVSLSPVSLTTGTSSVVEEDARPTTASTSVTTRVVVQRASQISVAIPNRPRPGAPLPASWTAEHDRALCFLDTTYTNPARIVARMKKKFPVLEEEKLTAEMVDVRLRVLDQDIEVEYWREALARIDAAAERGRERDCSGQLDENECVCIAGPSDSGANAPVEGQSGLS